MKTNLGCILFFFFAATAQALEPVEEHKKGTYSKSTNYLINRIEKVRTEEKDHLSLIQYRENYLVYSSLRHGVNQEPVDSAFPDETHSFRDYELQFQLSFMVPVWVNMFDQPLSLYGAYTNRSFWQFFDAEDSRPFRETNHEPELWLSWDYDLKAGDFRAPMIWLGFRHQSNGQYVSMSRGWNRMYVQTFFAWHNWSSSLSYWERIREGAPEDERFDYEKFIGNGEFRLDYTFEKSELGMIYSYSFAGFDYGSVTLQYSHAMAGALDLYVRYFYGYGESLIDIEYLSNTISVGVLLNEW